MVKTNFAYECFWMTKFSILYRIEMEFFQSKSFWFSRGKWVCNLLTYRFFFLQKNCNEFTKSLATTNR